MLDVILYGFDRRGLLTLQERTFSGLHELARFFATGDRGTRWLWAEIEVSADTGQARVVKYTADSLRALVMESSRIPSAN